ncbi:MAG: phenylalanine 4-monooxygenase [Marinilabiliales bacterium]|nr:MAG: phenylalanine 4-monooxygenase [Marinilabiliales bacterium]
MFENPVLEKLPKHLTAFIVEQDYNSYTAQDQAVWRYVMRQNVNFLSKYAHETYIDGLKKTGISVDHIPSTEVMNDILGKIGWASVTVDGFIPPAAFMEFQKYNVLVIAADIRPIHQIEYTPAPDIIHEAAGHAPIISNPEYAAYLRKFGEIGSKAFSSKKDYEIYEAIRRLSILKTDPNSTIKDIENAEMRIDELSLALGPPSEMSLIRNLHWWTVEYGLIGTIDQPKIYGAGLLSSIGESVGALKKNVIKLPYDINARDYSFDITKPQPQLFVTPNFQHLSSVLEEFASFMALSTGGLDGIIKAIESGNTSTLVYSSGLQVSGTFTDMVLHNGNSVYIKTNGPTTLNYEDEMLDGHGKSYHKDGFGSPIGKIKGTLKPTRFLSNSDLSSIGIKMGKETVFEFESGIKIKGILRNVLRKDGKLLLMSFSDCLVQHDDIILFEPGWGTYDMAVGENIVSAFSGPADAEGFGLEYSAPVDKTHKIKHNQKTQKLHQIYQNVRDVRKHRADLDVLKNIWKEFIQGNYNDWLLPIEILEMLTKGEEEQLKTEINNYLNALCADHENYAHLIKNGKDVIGRF